MGLATSVAIMSSYWVVTILGLPRRRAMSRFTASAFFFAPRLGSSALTATVPARRATVETMSEAKISTAMSGGGPRGPCMPLCLAPISPLASR